MSILWRSAGTALIWSLLAVGVRSADEPAKPEASDDPVAAKVDQHEITVSDIHSLLKSTPATSGLSPGASPQLEAQALEQLVNRAAVSEQLKRAGYRVSEEELDRQVKQIEEKTPGDTAAFDQALGRRGLTREGLRRQLAWETIWNKYARDRATDAKLQAFFDAHRRDFDGTEVRVSHILLRPVGTLDAAALQATVRQAAELRAQIEKGDVSFADAAKRYSAGPSRQSGGDLGYIPRHDRMVEPFSQAAFALEPGQISSPVATPFGVHLIRVTDLKPGSKTWRDVRDALQKAYDQELFNGVAAEARQTAKVEYSPDVPHLDPLTHQLVTP